MTRQYGNLSFTRVYQAGHMVPSYQPEAVRWFEQRLGLPFPSFRYLLTLIKAYRIFMRAITHRDIATGQVDLNEYATTHKDQYSTTGTSDTWWKKNDVLPQTKHECYVLDQASRCTDEEVEWIKDGSAIIKDWIVVGRNPKGSSSVNQEGIAEEDDHRRGGQQVPLLAKDW